MGASPLNRRLTAAREVTQRSDGGEARLWHLGTALTVSFGVAMAGLAGLAWLAWVLLGLAGYRRNGAPELKDTISVLQLVFATVAGAGALVALIVAYRRQKITEADSVHDRARVFNERFTAIAGQLGDAQPAVRLAGVHAMAGLADDWKQNRQTCIDVLCACLRLPHDPDPGDAAGPGERTAYRADREVRHTIIRLIGAHLRPGAAVSWQGLNFDFTGAVFDGGDLSGARFSGIVLFTSAAFAGGLVDFRGAAFTGGQVDFRDAEFTGGQVDFGSASFTGGKVDFSGAAFTDGQVNFARASFTRGKVDFSGAAFTGGLVDFRHASFAGGKIYFGSASFTGGKVDFSGAKFSDAKGVNGQVSFARASFTGGQVDFSGAAFTDGHVNFARAAFTGGWIDFRDASFTGGQVDFRDAEFTGGLVDFRHAEFADFASGEVWSYPPVFSWDGKPPAGVVLPVQLGRETKGSP